MNAESRSTALDAPRERLWSETEDSFHRLLERAVGVLASDDDPNHTLGNDWRETLKKTAMRTFDDLAPIDAFGEIDPDRVVTARRLLTLGLAGYGKYGRSLCNELNLVSPEEAGKRGKPTRRKKEEAQA